MKNIHITLEDEEYNCLTKIKGKRTWKEILMEECKDGS